MSALNKIKLFKGNKKQGAADFKPITAQISLWDSSSQSHIKPQNNQIKSNRPNNKPKCIINDFKDQKQIDLSFEEEIDIESIYKENSILDQNKLQKWSKQTKHHRRKPSEFDEEGKENLSSEGNEHDFWDNSKTANQPKIQQEKFNDLNKKFSRNFENQTDVIYKTGKQAESRNTLQNGDFVNNKFTYLNLQDNGNKQNYQLNMRRTQAHNSKIPHINRSRNRSRKYESEEENNQEVATSNILSDKLRESLSTLNLNQQASKRYAKNLKNMEKDLNQENLKPKCEAKEKLPSESKIPKPCKASQDKKIVNNKILGNIIKNNINELTSKIELKNSKIQERECNYNKENCIDNEKIGWVDQGIEIYNLNQYWSAANINAFGSQNFTLPKNMILCKNRSRELSGFGSPTLRKVDLQKEKSKDAFDSIMTKHGLLKDLNNLNSFNEFWKQSPLRHQRSLDYWYKSINSTLYPGMQEVMQMKTWTEHQINFNSNKEFISSPNSIMSQFSPNGLNRIQRYEWENGDENQPGYSFPFQRRARSASPPKDPNVNAKLRQAFLRDFRENNTSAVDDLLEDQVMGLQDPLRSQNSIHSRMGSGNLKSRKPIIANTNLFFIGGSTGIISNRNSLGEDRNLISSDKMKVLSKAINHYLNGEYDKIMDQDEINPDDINIANDIWK